MAKNFKNLTPKDLDEFKNKTVNLKSQLDYELDQAFGVDSSEIDLITDLFSSHVEESSHVSKTIIQDLCGLMWSCSGLAVALRWPYSGLTVA